jgi:O-antigen/teichoic acid export membrane protein
MNRELNKFIIKTFTAALILLVFGWIVFTFFVPDKYIAILPWMLLIFLIITLVTFTFQLQVAKKNMARSSRIGVLVSFLRLVLYSAFAFIYLAKRPENAAVFVVCLVICYLVFTFLEVAELTKISKNLKK